MIASIKVKEISDQGIMNLEIVSNRGVQEIISKITNETLQITLN